ncbi:hypothetical protein RJ640_004324 [Escallonia rubra]|uniref:Glycosyltransferase n=1 Tax=Escallonia rubra TaxID=112253 RepID=A0AA88RA31_9ASTE|nr:hypothetical protein RJ640_004324 [Escallonia rubra]
MPSERKQNIVMFPFMAQGHIIPFLGLALKLEKERGFKITFINTPLNIKRLQPSIPPNSSIRLLEIPFNSSHLGLPPNAENTETLALDLMLRFIESSPSLKPAFEELICTLVNEQNGQPPLCIISDMFFGWSAEVAHKFGVFHAIFNAGGGYGMAVFHTTWLNLPHKTTEANSNDFPLPGFPKNYRFKSQNLTGHQKAVTGPWHFGLEMFQEWLETDAMLFNTVEEIDRIGLTYFRQQFSCHVWSIGPILSPLGSKARGGKEAETTLNVCMEWLNSKANSSVLYIAFGSQSAPSESQTMQLATALEASGHNFIWVVRSPSTFAGVDRDFKDNEVEWLPRGFEQRVRESGRGLLVQEWAPQMEILSHASIGAFMSHCGWNSVNEALSNGVPLLSWPMGAEQPFNAMMLEEEIGVAVGVANGSDCEVRHEDLVRKIELVMNGTGKGKDMKRKACEAEEMIKSASKDKKGFKGSSVKAVDEFLDAALQPWNRLQRSQEMLCTL